MIRPVPKPSHKRLKPTRKQRGEFSASVRKEIIERDQSCRVCGGRGEQIHHVMPKGSGKGRGVVTNGMLVCHRCHTEIHNDNNKLKFWQRVFSEMYGPNYYLDRWDLDDE